MPFTPFHFGPGALVNVIAPARVSFLGFCAANIVIDLESLYFLLAGQMHVHRFLHTYVGATLVTGLVLVMFVALKKAASRWRLPNTFEWQKLVPLPVLIGAALGSYSHIVLDSIMHQDIRPLWPFSPSNGLYLLMSIDQLQMFCMACAAMAAMVMVVRWVFKKKSAPG